jgi:hypothetical protein
MDPYAENDLFFLQYTASALSPRVLETFFRHLQNCDACQARLTQERNLTMLLHLSRPFFDAPAELRARVVATFKEHLKERAAVSEESMRNSPTPVKGFLAPGPTRPAPEPEPRELRRTSQCGCFQRVSAALRRK